MQRLILLFVLYCIPMIQVCSQNHEIFDDRIASLQVVANDDWTGVPVIRLAGNDVINISFDDLTHEYNRYTYTITHCEADWSESKDLFASDYIHGFREGVTIDDYEESINTNTLFLHYHFQIPNQQCQVKMSGNYQVDVFDDDTKEKVFTARFMVYEPIVDVSSEIITNTDIDIRNHHQQMNLSLRYPTTLQVNDHSRQVRVAIMQNQRYDNMVWCPPAPIVRQGTLEWTHTKELIFSAGNEYHKFEILDPHRNSLGVDKIVWDGEWYNVHIYHDYPRRAYVYDEDANGAFYIRNTDNIENDIASDYVMVHFYLDTPPLDGNVYVDGRWSINNLSDKYLMEYDEENHCYHAAIPLKLGYYNYQYLLIPDAVRKVTPGVKQTLSHTLLTEGDFYQTENDYLILVYYRADHERTWRLVGVGKR